MSEDGARLGPAASAGGEGILDAQRAVCRRYGLGEVALDQMVAVALSTVGAMPVYGARIIPAAGDNVTWFFYSGEHSDAADFYQPLHVAHLAETLPLVVPYLRLPHGSRFIIDDEGYEDVWLDG